MSRGKRWKSRRRLISPAFHFTIINDFVPTFVECGEKLCVELNRQRASNQNVIEHLMNPIEICALQIICQTSIGVSLESIKSGDKDRVGLDYTRTLAEITHVAFERSLNPVMDCDFLFYCTGRGRQFQKNIDRMKSFMDHVIKERIQKRNELKKAKKTNNNNDDDSGSGKNSESLVNEEQPYFYGKLKRKRAFLDLLVDTMLDQAGQTVSAEEKLDLHAIREEVNTFTFEGFDTTSTTLFATIYLLGKIPVSCQVWDSLKHS